MQQRIPLRDIHIDQYAFSIEREAIGIITAIDGEDLTIRVATADSWYHVRAHMDDFLLLPPGDGLVWMSLASARRVLHCSLKEAERLYALEAHTRILYEELQYRAEWGELVPREDAILQHLRMILE